MTTTAPTPTIAAPPQGGGTRGGRVTPVAGFLLVLVGLVVVLAAVHLTQGTADLSVGDLVRVLFGQGAGTDTTVVVWSRLPRLVAGLCVGVALGVAGATLQSVCRNPLASPDTLAVNAGAHLALTLVAAFGVSLPLLSSAGVAFVGGLARVRIWAR